MAKCKLCKAEIPEGKEYCNNCQDKGKQKANESYLDSLLNSVKNNVPAETIYKKKNSSSGNSPEPSKGNKKELDDQEDSFYQLDPNDIEDFDQFYKKEDLNDISEDITIPEEDLFGEKLSDLFDEIDRNPYQQDNAKSVHKNADNNIKQIQPETSNPAKLHIGTDISLAKQNPFSQEVINNLSENSAAASTLQPTNVNPINTNTDPINTNTDYINTYADNDFINDIQQASDEVLEQDGTNKDNLEDEEDDFDPDINDLLNSLNLEDDNTESTSEAANKQAPIEQEKKEAVKATKPEEEFEQIEPEEDDFLSLLNQISSDDPVADDVKAINDLLNGRPIADKDKSGTPSDVGEVFSDALKVVSSLNDPTAEELAILDKIPDRKGKKDKTEEEVGKKKKKKGSGKKGKSEQAPDDGQPKPKKGLFKRLFGNVEDENVKNKQQSAKSKSGDSSALKEGASKDAGKKKKAPKGKKGAPAPEQDDEEVFSGARGKGKPSEDKGSVKKDNKKDKKEKKEKKKKTKEIIQVIDEIEEDEGRINRLGASIVFVFFGLLALLLLVGTNVISYTLSIQHATNYFDHQKYNQAYKEVYGEEIQAEDIELYEKIMTVMFVNKQLNSYNNYYSLGKYPEALDSLLKGLKRYDKYIELATMLGIDSDLDYVRTQILAELKNVFSLSETEALRINSSSDMKEYSLEVYNIAHEKMND